MEKSKKIQNTLNEEIMIAFMPTILIFIVEIFFKILNGGILYINTNSLMFSIIMGYIIYGIILSIVKNTSKATTIFSCFFTIILLINQTKIIYTGEPIYFSDINFLNKISDLTQMLSTNIVSMSIKNIILIIVLGLILFIIAKWNKKYDFKITNIKPRIIIASISIIAIIILFAPIPYTKEIYLNLFFGMNKHEDYNSYTTNYDFYIRNTLMSGMYGVLLNNRFSEPENYDEKELEDILEMSSQNISSKNNEKPNIIVVFSESFWDIDRLEEVKFDKQVAANYKKLSGEGHAINLISCTYGGMSENVAFELLTGGKLNYFSNGYIPIMSLYQRTNSEQIPSLIKELKNNNYETKIAFGKDYYNSEKAFLKMGFDEYLEVEQNNENTKGQYVSDEYMTDLIINNLQNKEKDKKLFYMVETIQNHMTYTINKYSQYDINIEQSGLDEDMNNTLVSYAQGVYDADQQLNRLYEYIQNFQEPTIILFLGDHLPYLYTEKGKNVIDKLEYFNTEDELQNTLRKYNTQSIILSNYEFEYENIPQYLSADLLLTSIINQTGIEVSNYYKWLYSTNDSLPAYNKYIAVDNYGEIYDINKMQEKMKNVYNIREKMQFKLFIKPTL